MTSPTTQENNAPLKIIADKYRGFARHFGAAAALVALQRDIGSGGVVQFTGPSKLDAGGDKWRARLPDVCEPATTTPVVGEGRGGRGEAVGNLLEHILQQPALVVRSSGRKVIYTVG
ncbi:MAG: hypothetical protein WBK91_02385 [Alphaproteobacteria bacterium]